jgi:hypothetical protein
MTEMHSIDWRRVLLKQNPFPNTPPVRPEDAVWAGFPALRKQLDALFAESLSTSRTQIVLNRGEYGSGKTHAAIFYRRLDNLSLLDGDRRVKDPEIVYIRTPKEPDKADITLYQNIIEVIQFRRIRTVIKEIITEYGDQNALEKFQNLIESEQLGKALWLLGHEQERSGQLALFQGNLNDQQNLIESYFFSQITKSDLKRLGLSRSINNIQDRFRVLGCILQCFIGFADEQDVAKHRRVILWVDELEDLILYPARYYRPFTQGLRDLIDRLPSYFTLMMNFTLASPESLEDIDVVLGKAVMDRITDKVYFREPNEVEAFDYVKDLLRHYRIEPNEPVRISSTYPFEEEALRMLIANLPVRTPRRINQLCASVIGEALRRGIIRSPGKDAITKEFVRKVEDERIEFDVR